MNLRFLLCLIVIFSCWLVPLAGGQTVTETTLYSFTGVFDGTAPSASLIQASDGNFYGTTAGSGDSLVGTIFGVSPSGQFQLVADFCEGTNAACYGYPGNSQLIEGSDGALYGTIPGDDQAGLVYKAILPDNTSTEYQFCLNPCPYGGYPQGGVVLGSDGYLYGTTLWGGSGVDSEGVIYKISPAGKETVLYSFCPESDCEAGAQPIFSLVQGTDGWFYGVTTYGGANGLGTIFKVSEGGDVVTLHDFCSPSSCLNDGSPASALVQGSDGSFYGTTLTTVFKVTQDGVFTTLHVFCTAPGDPCADGYSPVGHLMVGSDGAIYGTTLYPQVSLSCFGSSCGTIYRLTSGGDFQTVYTFPSGCSSDPCEVEIDGTANLAGLVQGEDGSFYGVNSAGGPNYRGTVFKLATDPPLPAPVQLSFSVSDISQGSETVLTWKVLNAFSTTMRQCYSSVAGSAQGAGTWNGFAPGIFSGGVYSGQSTIKPTASGVYTYALTCGGIESGFASLSVSSAKAPTTVALSGNTPVSLGAPATFVATVISRPYYFPIEGLVTFSTGGLILGTVKPSNGVATLTLQERDVPAGIYVVTAVFAGDDNYEPSSANFSVTALPTYSTQTTLTSSTSTAIQGVPFTLSITVKRLFGAGYPQGNVVLNAEGTNVATASLVNGNAQFKIDPNGSNSPQSYGLTASYSGDTQDQSSYGSTSINLVAPTLTSLSVSPNFVVPPAGVTATAKVTEKYGGPVFAGTVIFQSGTQILGAGALDSNGIATAVLSSSGVPAGSYAVSAYFQGNGLDAASSSAGVEVSVR